MPFLDIKNCFNEPKHLVRLFVLIFCICSSIYQLSGCVEKIRNPPISTSYKYFLNESMVYPAVTICRTKPFKTSAFTKYGLEDKGDAIYYNDFFKNFNTSSYDLEQFIKEITYGISEVFGKQNGFDQNGNIGESVWKNSSFYSYKRGQCHTIQAYNASKHFDFNGGYSLKLKYTTEKPIRTSGLFDNGFEIFLHDPHEIVLDNDEHTDSFINQVFLSPDELLLVQLKVETFQQAPNKNCNSTPTYTKSKCLEDCFHKNISSQVQCTLPWMRTTDLFPICTNLTAVAFLMDRLITKEKYLDKSICNCLNSCKVTIYSSQVLNRQIYAGQSLSQIRLFYSTNTVTVIEEVIGYDWNYLLADVGGSLGFLLGLSVIGFIELLEGIFEFIFGRCRRQKKVNKNNAAPSQSRRQSNINDHKDLTKIIYYLNKKVSNVPEKHILNY